MRVLNQKTITDKDFPKRIKCDNCQAELEYDKDDVFIGEWGMKYIHCPCCEENIPVSEDRYMPITWPTTFQHTSKENAVEIDGERVSDYVEEIKKKLMSSEPGDYTMISTGDCFVFGYKTEEEIEIIVTKDYYSDFIDLNED